MAQQGGARRGAGGRALPRPGATAPCKATEVRALVAQGTVRGGGCGVAVQSGPGPAHQRLLHALRSLVGCDGGMAADDEGDGGAQMGLFRHVWRICWLEQAAAAATRERSRETEGTAGRGLRGCLHSRTGRVETGSGAGETPSVGSSLPRPWGPGGPLTLRPRGTPPPVPR